MNLCAGVLAAIWLGITIPQYTDTLNIEEVINLPVKAEMEYTISNEEFELLCKCVEAEAVKFYHLKSDCKGGYFRYGRQPITILPRNDKANKESENEE